jgi:predicted transcriptional regulator of viral defense system
MGTEQMGLARYVVDAVILEGHSAREVAMAHGMSGETALDLHELCDVSPAHIDITVPRNYRTHRQVPARYRLHRHDLANDEVTWLRDAC